MSSDTISEANKAFIRGSLLAASTKKARKIRTKIIEKFRDWIFRHCGR